MDFNKTYTILTESITLNKQAKSLLKKIIKNKASDEEIEQAKKWGFVTKSGKVKPEIASHVMGESINEERIPDSMMDYVKDALDKVITGMGSLTPKETTTLFKYELMDKNGHPTSRAKEEFSELFESALSEDKNTKIVDCKKCGNQYNKKLYKFGCPECKDKTK